MAYKLQSHKKTSNDYFNEAYFKTEDNFQIKRIHDEIPDTERRYQVVHEKYFPNLRSCLKQAYKDEQKKRNERQIQQLDASKMKSSEPILSRHFYVTEKVSFRAQ